MQLGIFAKTFDGKTPGSVMAAAKAAGFATVQYNMACSGLDSMPDMITAGTADDIAIAAKAHGVAVCAISGTYNMIHPDKAVRTQGLQRLQVLVAKARPMGTRLITLCTGTRDPHDQWRHHPDNDSREAWRDLVTEVRAALAIADRYEVDLGIEPELANVVNSAEKAAFLIKDMGSKRLRVVLDAANLFEHEGVVEQRRIVSSAIDMLGPHIAMAHAKDRSADGHFVAAGTGVLDYDHYLSELAAAGFNGPLVTHGLSADEAPEVAGFLRSALNVIA